MLALPKTAADFAVINQLQAYSNLFSALNDRQCNLTLHRQYRSSIHTYQLIINSGKLFKRYEIDRINQTHAKLVKKNLNKNLKYQGTNFVSYQSLLSCLISTQISSNTGSFNESTSKFNLFFLFDNTVIELCTR